MQNHYQKLVFRLILITTIIKIIAACFLELGNDEAYYYTYALQPDFSHFDHPPFVGFLIQLTTLNLHVVTDVTMRLGAIVGCAISTWFIFKTGSIIASEKLGWLAALIYNCSIYTGFIAGFFILPDSPQMPIYTAALYTMLRIVLQEKNTTKNFLLLGLLIGAAALCKVHGLFLWVGFGLFILLKKPILLKNVNVYFAILITLICLLPIVYWNIENNFITYTFHSERVSNTSLQWGMLLQEIVGEIAYQNPIVIIAIIIGIKYCIQHPLAFRKPILAWLLLMSLPMILLFWIIALFNPTLPHWSGPAYIPLYFIAAKYFEEKKTIFPVLLKTAVSLLIIVLVAAILMVQLAPFNLGSQEKEKFGEFCPTLDISGWNNFGKKYQELFTADVANKKMKATDPILISKWFPGGHIRLYVATKTNQQVMAVGSLIDIHKFAWINKTEPNLQIGQNAYCIVPSNVPFNVFDAYKNYFTNIEAPVIIPQIRGGKTVRNFYVYRLIDCKKIPEKTSF